MANPPKTPESIKFGHEVRKCRKSAKLTQSELAERLNVVRSYVSQVETGAAQCREDFAKRLDEVLGTGAAIHEAWREFIEPLQEEKFPKFFANFPRAEQNATMIRAYEYSVVYGLLQTKEYASVLLRGEKDLANRLERQAVLRRENPPLVCVVMSEAVLHTLVGSPKIMREQLEELIEASHRDRICLQIAPLQFYRGVWGSFHIATQSDGTSIAYGDIVFGGETTSDPGRVGRANEAFAILQAQAHNVSVSREVMREVIKEKWT